MQEGLQGQADLRFVVVFNFVRDKEILINITQDLMHRELYVSEKLTYG